MLNRFQNVFFASWLQFPISMITNVIVIRYLGPELRGEYVLLASFATILSILASFSLPTSIVFHVSKKRINHYSGFLIYLIFIFIFFIVSCSIILSLETLLSSINLIRSSNIISNKWFAIGLGFTLALNNFFNTVFLGEGKSRDYFVINLIKVTVLLVLIIIFSINYSLSPLLVIIAMLFANFLSCLSAFLLSQKSIFTIKNKSSKEPIPLKDILKYAIKRFPSSVFPMIVNQAPNWIIGQALGLKMLGLFSVALTFFNASLSIPRALSSFLVGETSRRTSEEAAELASKSSRIYTVLMFMIFIGCIIFLPYLIPLLFGVAFIESYLPSIILVGSVIFTASSSSLETYFLSINRPGLTTIINFFSMAGIVLLMPIFVSHFDLVGASLTFLFIRIMVWISLYFLFKKNVKKSLRIIIAPLSELSNVIRSTLERINIFKS